MYDLYYTQYIINTISYTDCHYDVCRCVFDYQPTLYLDYLYTVEQTGVTGIEKRVLNCKHGQKCWALQHFAETILIYSKGSALRKRLFVTLKEFKCQASVFVSFW